MKTLLLIFSLITITFTSQAYAAPEVVAMLDSRSGPWRVVRYADQGRCAVQSPRIDGTIMIINVKKANPDELFFTFLNPEVTMWSFSKGKPEGHIAVYQEPPRYEITYDSIRDKTIFPNIPVWVNSYKKDGIGVYYQEDNENLFTTVVPNRFQGIDPNTSKPINLLDILTGDEYRRYYNWNIVFTNTNDPEEEGHINYMIPIDQMPNLTPFLNCLS